MSVVVSAVVGAFVTGVVGTTAVGAIVTAAAITAVQGAILGAVIGGVTAAITGGNILDGILRGATTGAISGAIIGGLGKALQLGGEALAAGKEAVGAVEALQSTEQIGMTIGEAGEFVETGTSVAQPLSTGEKLLSGAKSFLNNDATKAALINTGGKVIAGLGSPDQAEINQQNLDAQLATPATTSLLDLKGVTKNASEVVSDTKAAGNQAQTTTTFVERAKEAYKTPAAPVVPVAT